MRRLPAALLALVAAAALWSLARADCEAYRLLWDHPLDGNLPVEYRVVCTEAAGAAVEYLVPVADEPMVKLSGKTVQPGTWTCQIEARNDAGYGPTLGWSAVEVGPWTRCCEVKKFRAVSTSARSEWNEDGTVATTHSITRAVQGERVCPD